MTLSQVEDGNESDDKDREIGVARSRLWRRKARITADACSTSIYPMMMFHNVY